jgi:hypothetical protein
MGKVFDSIDEKLAAWIGRQRLFFVGTAPSGAGGHVNVSPKGPIESLRILDPGTIAYQDVIGSGAETIAHLRENGRIVVMLCAFSGPPRILRLHGTGEVVGDDDPRFAGLAEGLPSIGPPESTRSVIVVDVHRIADSCGYGVPLMSVDGERDHYALSAAKRLRVGGPEALAARRAEVNGRSIDGLPALDPA